MSFELDVTKIKALKEANPLFKPASDANLANRSANKTYMAQRIEKALRAAGIDRMDGNVPLADLAKAIGQAGVSKVVYNYGGGYDDVYTSEIVFHTPSGELEMEDTPDIEWVFRVFENAVDYIGEDWKYEEGGGGTLTIDTKTGDASVDSYNNITSVNSETQEIGIDDESMSGVCDALAKVGVTTIVIDYSGSGDSGEVNSIEALKGNKPFKKLPPDISLDIFGDLTEQIQGDWYNNEGGQGTIEVNVKTKTATINAEYNYDDTESSEQQQTFKLF